MPSRNPAAAPASWLATAAWTGSLAAILAIAGAAPGLADPIRHYLVTGFLTNPYLGWAGPIGS